ncbi:riboflavin kinase [Shinella daejeonensis]|uniref:riboflavin kinase n=1 Tax=Shinella daejeonensis TaxID=659017 RepID=UPI0020C7C37E|nr:riboflavin kinase [Shinella daejeonensis]MCP8894563.1 riboflavin kinase [Shinella daejeonensis]
MKRPARISPAPPAFPEPSSVDAVFRGVVVKGARIGRQLGYPTANMAVPEHPPVPSGVYAVWFTDASGRRFAGVASLGVRPTVEADGKMLLETHLFDFCGDLYGQVCEVTFCHLIRPELKFGSLAELRAQIERDAVMAKSVLSGTASMMPFDLSL